MTLRRYVVGGAIAALVWAPDAAATSSGTASPVPTMNILLLYASPRLNVAQTSLDEAFRSAVSSRSPGTAYFYTEYLDLTLFTADDIVPEVRALLKRKYSGVKLDLLFVAHSGVLRLMLRHRAELFPGVPMVFASVDKAATASIALPDDVTGLWLVPGWAATLDAALGLQPETRRVVVVTGSGVVDRVWRATATTQLGSYRGRVDLTFLTNVSLDELGRRLGELSTGTIVLFGPFTRDTGGQDLVSRDVLQRMTPKTAVPVYGLTEASIGTGVVGGHVVNFERMGATAADVGLGLLRGERAPPTDAATNAYVFDWRQLRRWGLDERRLPPGAVIRFREPSVWAAYKWYVVAAVALVLTQSALIAGLLVNRAQRRRAEETSRRQREQLAHALRIAPLGELAASIAHEINQPLAAILTNSQATRRLLSSGGTEHDTIQDALTDIAQDAHRASEVVRRLRALFSHAQAERMVVDINLLIAEALALLRADIDKKGIAVRLELAAELSHVLGDPIQLQQVILNVLVNGVEAIAADAKGPAVLAITSAEPERGRVVVTVRDSGVGAHTVELHRIFDPFVTSKRQGLGMGLAISRSILEAHGGRIRATVNADRGLTLHIELPAATEVATGTPTDDVSGAPPRAPGALARLHHERAEQRRVGPDADTQQAVTSSSWV